jgi:hypothetical protein
MGEAPTSLLEDVGLQNSTAANKVSNTLKISCAVVLFLLEGLIFYQFYAVEVVEYFPGFHDQTLYLTTSYRLQEEITTNGIHAVVREIVGPTLPTGLLLPIEGVIPSFLISDPRLARLILNFAVFCGLQVTVFLLCANYWRNMALGVIAVGLLLCTQTAWFWAGGIFDFRLDFIAFCLYGIWVCLVIYSNVYLSTTLSVVGGLVAALLVLHRFLTGVYLFVILVYLLFLFVAYWVLVPEHRRNSRVRLLNLALSSAYLFGLTTPILSRNWSAIHGYYVGLHATGEERWVRLKEAGVTSLVDFFAYYPRSLVEDHLGRFFYRVASISRARRDACGSAEIIRRTQIDESIACSLSCTRAIFPVGCRCRPLNRIDYGRFEIWHRGRNHRGPDSAPGCGRAKVADRPLGSAGHRSNAATNSGGCYLHFGPWYC